MITAKGDILSKDKNIVKYSQSDKDFYFFFLLSSQLSSYS